MVMTVAGADVIVCGDWRPYDGRQATTSDTTLFNQCTAHSETELDMIGEKSFRLSS